MQKPHPSLWIGGSGEQVTLKLVAKYGNACNIGGEPDHIKQRLGVLRNHCEALGRNYDDIIRSSNSNLFLINPGEDPEKATEKTYTAMGISYETFAQNFKIGTPDEIRAYIQAKVDVGVNYVIAYFPRVARDHEQLHRFAEEIIPHFQ